MLTHEYHTYGVEVIVVGGNTVERGVLTAPSGGDETGQYDTTVGRGVRTAPSGCDETWPGDTTVGRGVLTAPQPYPNGSSLPVGFGANGTLSTPVRVHEIRYGRADSPRFTRTYTDGFGDVIREERSGVNGATLVTENEYDALGRVAATIDALTNATTYAYDANSQLLQVGNATPTNVISQYDYTYDAARRRIACMLSALRAVEMPMVKVL